MVNAPDPGPDPGDTPAPLFNLQMTARRPDGNIVRIKSQGGGPRQTKTPEAKNTPVTFKNPGTCRDIMMAYRKHSQQIREI